MIREKIALPLLKLYRKNIVKYLEMNRELFSDENKLKNYQQQRLERLLFHAYENTDYYREIFNDVYLIRDGKINWDRFSDVPLLTKSILRNQHESLLSADYKKRHPYKNTSGGSTGEPVQLIQDKDYNDRMVADTLFFAELYGKKTGEREIKIWGSEADFFKEKKQLKNKIINFFFNRLLLNSFQLNDDLICQYIEVIDEVKPKMIWTYVDSIFEIAKYINRNNFVDVFQPDIIVCTAGTMYKEMRDVIQNAFPNSIILNQYGSREVGIVGIGDEELAIFRQSILMELYDKKTKHYLRNHGMGNIIVTALNNYAMPLIKFDIGDIGESESIDGTNVKSLKKLNGRENAHIVRKDGSLIHGELFTHLFYFIDEIKKFQVIQEETDRFSINLETSNEKIQDQTLLKIRQKINEIMMENCTINFNMMKDLPKLKSGKYQFVFSKVKNG
jgi:phenylacetate-CoA ligase